MRYTKITSAEELRKKYDVLIGWGAGRDAFSKCYNPFGYKLDVMIDTARNLQGMIINGIKIEAPSQVVKYKDKKICLIIFPNLEEEIIAEAEQYLSEFDTIVGSLVSVDKNPLGHFYSTEREDLIIVNMLDKLGVQNPTYMDIGVCHPVIRNNTYLLYEKGHHDGVLVEPNLDMCSLAEIYRPANRIVKAGASPLGGNKLRYYVHPNPSYRGHNTFDEEIAREEGSLENYREVPVISINEIVEKNFDSAPDFLDIDTEGMDYELLKSLDTDKHPVKIICVEVWKNASLFADMMEKKGYIHFMSTIANNIYIRKELL